MTVRHLFDFFRGKSREKFPGQNTEKGVAQSIDPFEMLEQQNQPFEMSRLELAIDIVKRMRNCVEDPGFLEVTLQLVDVISQSDYLSVLSLGDPPNEQMNFTRILRKISGNFLADKSMI